MVTKIKSSPGRGKRKNRADLSATAQVFLTAFRTLPEAVQGEIVSELLEDEGLREDIMDLAVHAARRNEPTVSLDDYLIGNRRK